MEQIERTVREYLEQDSHGGVHIHFDRDDSLTQAGVVDSMGLFRLIFFLEQTYGISVNERDMTGENFDSLARISAFVKSMESSRRV